MDGIRHAETSGPAADHQTFSYIPTCTPMASQQPQQQQQQQQCTVTQRPPKKPMCRMCRNHGKIRPTRGHKHECLHRDCRCDKCELTLQNRRTNAVQVANRRQEAKAKRIDEVRAEAFTPHLDPSLQVDYSLVENHVGSAVAQWPLVIPLFMQQYRSKQHAHSPYYNYNYSVSSPYCYWMEPTHHATSSGHSVRFDPYHNRADYFRLTESGVSCQLALAQLQPRAPKCQSFASRLSKRSEFSDRQDVHLVTDVDRTAHTNVVHPSVESIVASLGFWNATADERSKLQKSAVAAGNYTVASLLKDARVTRGDGAVAITSGKDSLESHQ